MIHPRQIHDYLDGKSDAAAESLLFAQLAADAEARQELTQQIRLHIAVKKDLAAIAVPADATTFIFSELGYHVPGGSAPFVHNERQRRRWLIPLLLILFLAGGVLGSRWLWPSTVVVSQSNTSPSPAQAPVSPQTTFTAPPDREAANTPPAIARSFSVDVAPPVIDSASARQQTDLAISHSPFVEFEAPQNVHLNQSFQSTQLFDSQPVQSIQSHSPWRATARGLSTISTTPTNMSSQETGALSQFSLGLSYHMSDDDILSLVGGRQLVHQEFTRYEYGRDVAYSQTPLLWWVGASYDHDFSQLSIGDAITPYASATLGWMQTGPMAQVSAGLHLFRHQQLSFDLAVNGMVMTYPIQSTYYTSSTIFISYGLSYRF